jgi:parallel beta-helix repeat protein
VIGNELLDNGFRENGPGGNFYEFAGVTLVCWGTGREGLAIDGSSDNVVIGNVFRGNSAGGVYLYTNCGEYPNRDRYFERRYPADRNFIALNTFDGGWHGVWVGSRMGENVFPMECTNPAYHEAPLVYYTLDRADNNTVSGNQFLATDYGVRVEDDGTRVLYNRFTGPDEGHHAIIVGTPHRTSYLNEPVRNTVVAYNRSEIVGNTSPYRWVHGVTEFADVDNIALGKRTAFCEGVEPPRNPFVMTIELGAPNPDGSIPPNPDVTLPVLGPIPPC